MATQNSPVIPVGKAIVPPSQLTHVENSSLSWPVKPAYVGVLTAGEEHQDEFGHVNNLVYPQWAVEAAWHHSSAIGFPYTRFVETGFGPVVWQHKFDYVAAVKLGDQIEVATWVAKNDGRLRMTRAYEMRLRGTDICVFRGETLFIWIEMASGRPVRMPKECAQAYAPAG